MFSWEVISGGCITCADARSACTTSPCAGCGDCISSCSSPSSPTSVIYIGMLAESGAQYTQFVLLAQFFVVLIHDR